MNVSFLNASQLKELLIAGGIVIAAVLLGKIFNWILTRLVTRFVDTTSNTFDDALLDAINLPAFLVIVVVGLQIALQQVSFIPLDWQSLRGHVFYVLYWGIGTLTGIRLITRITDWYERRMLEKTDTTLDEQVLPFARRVLIIIVGFIAFILLLSHFEINISAFVTTLGIGSLAVALAAQATLSDTINGFVIMADRPFRIGDRIEILELDTWGDVTDVGLRSTRIRTRDNRMVIVPNSVIGKSLIVNHSIPSTVYRVETHVGVGYGTALDQARKVMIESVEKQDWVMKDRRIEALFVEWGDSALIFRVRCWIEDYVETRRIVDKLNSCLYNALTEAGIELPFPTRTLYHHVDEKSRQGVMQAFQKEDKSMAADEPQAG